MILLLTTDLCYLIMTFKEWFKAFFLNYISICDHEPHPTLTCLCNLGQLGSTCITWINSRLLLHVPVRFSTFLLYCSNVLLPTTYHISMQNRYATSERQWVEAQVENAKQQAILSTLKSQISSDEAHIHRDVHSLRYLLNWSFYSIVEHTRYCYKILLVKANHCWILENLLMPEYFLYGSFCSIIVSNSVNYASCQFYGSFTCLSCVPWPFYLEAL